VPSDLPSVVLLILLNSADAVARLWPYVVAGVTVAVLLSRLAQKKTWPMPARLPRPLTTPLAAFAGAASPLPTLGMVPVVLRFRAHGLRSRPALAFVLASSLMNPQLLLLTLGAFGVPFALAQLGAVLLLSTGLGLLLGTAGEWIYEEKREGQGLPSTRLPLPATALAGHVGLYFLVGVILGASLQVLLPRFGVMNWLGTHGWLSTPVLGWLSAPFYVCGGSAVPLASSLARAGFSPGAMFAFLLVGPALRGTTLASLGCLLPRRALVVCLGILSAAGGLLGLGFNWLAGVG
jgi:uncharacterized membrane protein YraQ (UPF0718 family)